MKPDAKAVITVTKLVQEFSGAASKLGCNDSQILAALGFILNILEDAEPGTIETVAALARKSNFSELLKKRQQQFN